MSTDKKENEKDRGYWTHPYDFLVTSLGYAVGLGNIWRFPFLCYKHGGGSFLIPYFIMLILAGLPSLFLEMALGQYAGVSPIKLFGRLSPFLKGLGFSMVTLGLLFALFYNVVVSWSIWYLVSSFSRCSLKWTNCHNSFNTEKCVPVDKITEIPGVSSVEEYFNEFVLGGGANTTWENYGYPRIHSFVCIVFAWMIVGFICINGIKSSGKIAYVTTIFPYIILIAIGIRAFTLPGASQGIYFYLMPQWNRLLTFEIWIDAATQVIFTLGIACGCVITLSSYNNYNRNCQLDAITITFMNAMTSIFSGFVVFAILGYMAYTRGEDISEVAKGGPGLAFITYPEVVTTMRFSNIWSFLFFLMLVNLAFGSVVGVFETVLSSITDYWPDLRDKKSRIVACITFIMMILSIPFSAPGGIHLFTLFNSTVPSWNLLLIIFLEIIGIGWGYGANNFINDITNDMKIKVCLPLKLLWLFSWTFATPLVLLCLLVQFWRNYGTVEYNGYVYPKYIQILGNILTILTLIWIPIFAIKALTSKKGEEESLEPHGKWGRESYGGVESVSSIESNM
ncbi:sodium-dependent proline transporter [Lepeophtheirus salmonis]|uniref:sodium-dependent proline transporter n=1 Tax=Lepeophtheirus salmonis TaxID=72036 RepID=UPI001AE5A636|nr:sodium-dependent proline transporter-like isoform X1 [Lepeophtheirus salmonis]